MPTASGPWAGRRPSLFVAFPLRALVVSFDCCFVLSPGFFDEAVSDLLLKLIDDRLTSIPIALGLARQHVVVGDLEHA